MAQDPPDWSERLFVKELEDSTVNGFTVIELGDDRHRVAEKWSRAGESAIWSTYWVSHDKLADRLSDNLIDPQGNVSEEQFDKILAACKKQSDSPNREVFNRLQD